MEEDKLSWEALDHIKEEKSSDWYWVVGIIAIAGAVLAIFFNNILFAFLILLGIFSVFTISHIPPKNEIYEINKRGIKDGETFYPYSNLDSFYIVDEDGYERDRILIRSKKMFMPLITIPIEGKIDLGLIREYLLQHLDEEEMIEPPINHLMNWLGF